MSENASSADNQQGSRFTIGEVDPSETTRRISREDREMAIVVGILFTDGCVSPKGKNSWRIYLGNTCSGLIDRLEKAMSVAFLEIPHRMRRSRTKDGMFVGIVDSKAVGTVLTERFGTFRTLNLPNGVISSAKLPLKWLIDSGSVADFLRAAFSCDGGVAFYPASRKGARGGTQWLIRTVFLACAHPRLRLEYKELLAVCGIAAREAPRDGKLKIERHDDIARFAELIGFLPESTVTHHSKRWYGVQKQHLLELVLESYKSPSSFSRAFSRDNDIVRPL